MNKELEVKIKKLCDDAIIPSYAHDGDAGLDLTAISKSYDDRGNVVYGTGLSFEIPYGYVGLLFPRSSISKVGLALTNCVGVIDSIYRGEVTFKFNRIPGSLIEYEVKERIGQMIIMPYPTIKFVEVEDLNDTVRGDGGYGSTGV